jgi:hypothetical protein
MPDTITAPIELVRNSELPRISASLREVPGEPLTAIWLSPGSPGSTASAASPGLLNLVAPSEHPLLDAFDGTISGFAADSSLQHLTAELTDGNAAALRMVLPNLTPQPLGLTASAGFGDRLGVATVGHARSLQRILSEYPGSIIAPIFAQQSIREMARTRREPLEVLNDATWGAFAAGWTGPVGADADHLKTTADIDRCAAHGFTFYTIDPGDHVDDDAATASPAEIDAKLAGLPWAELESTQEELLSRYVGRKLEFDGVTLAFDAAGTARAVAKYGGALAHIARMYRHLLGLGVPFELEVSVDETGTPTTLLEHAFMALELRRMGVQWVSLAPRIVGAFEKGIDYRGDEAELIRYLTEHAALARKLGPYKLSLHSGSDKFSVFGPIAAATQGLVHLKTAGTSYLEALRILAMFEPAGFRQVLQLAAERFETDRQSYQISSELHELPDAAGLSDAELPGLLDHDPTRQVLHVTFGSALDAFGEQLQRVLRERHEQYSEGLASHFDRHLRPFAPHTLAPASRPAAETAGNDGE